MIPEFEKVRSSMGAGLPAGVHDVSLIDFFFKKSSNNNPMYNLIIQADNGEYMGTEDIIRIVVDPEDFNTFGWSRLKKIAEKAGFKWTGAKSLEAWCDQWNQDPPLRFAVKVEDQYNEKVLDDDGNVKEWKNDVGRKRWEELPEEARSRRSQIVDVMSAMSPPAANLSKGQTRIEEEDDSVPF